MMEKKIDRLLWHLKMEYSLMWILVLATVVLYESDVIPQGMWVDDERLAYLMKVLGILMTEGVIPLSVYMFKGILTRRIMIDDNPAGRVVNRGQCHLSLVVFG